jgi:two-component system NtrC family sensor kinase
MQNSIKDAICDPLFMVDNNMIVTYMNDACERLTGYKKAEVEGKMSCRDLFKNNICETTCPVRYSGKGEPVEGIRPTTNKEGKLYGDLSAVLYSLGIRATTIIKEGKQIPIMISASALRDAHGELIGAIEICKDITGVVEWANILEKRVEEKTEETRKTREQLIHSEKLASLGRMAAGVAHEINNPLTGIVTFGHLLLKRFPEGSQEREDSEVIIEQANRCSNIIKGLLGFARATSAEKIPVGINGIVNGSLDMIRHKADFFDIKFVLNFDEALPPVKANTSQIQQVFLNMLINAADAMEGKGTLTISTRKVIENGKPFAEVEFTDTGHGIPEENISKLFEPFFTTKPVGKGVGLGLAVSHGIIKDHEGEILVKSKVGEGTSFFARLPFYEG